LLGAAFGSPFPTTIYIGHPGWKALGARAGYSVMNAVFFTVLGLTGAVTLVEALVPVEAGMAIVLWIGIVMTSQAFQATPQHHAPAVAVGLLPSVAAFGVFMMKKGLMLGAVPFDASLPDKLEKTGLAAHGAFALEQGFLLSSMVWAAITAEIIEQRHDRAALWAAAGAGLSAIGLMHSYSLTGVDSIQKLAFVGGLSAGGEWAIAYALLAALLFGSRWLRHAPPPGPMSDGHG
jgi:AGZA family xanthine/uracil permease-like MFS transporter